MFIFYSPELDGENIIISRVLLRSLVLLGDDMPIRGDVGCDETFRAP